MLKNLIFVLHWQQRWINLIANKSFFSHSNIWKSNVTILWEMVFIKLLILKSCSTPIVNMSNPFGNRIIGFYQRGPQSIRKPFKMQKCELYREHVESKNDLGVVVTFYQFHSILKWYLSSKSWFKHRFKLTTITWNVFVPTAKIYSDIIGKEK